jgi:hypothetical protein
VFKQGLFHSSMLLSRIYDSLYRNGTLYSSGSLFMFDTVTQPGLRGFIYLAFICLMTAANASSHESVSPLM